MIVKFNLKNLRSAEHFQFISSACDIFAEYSLDSDIFGPLYDRLYSCRDAEEKALAAEKGNEKVREKNEMDSYRDRLHSKLFNYLKSITYDERDPRFDAAQRLMRLVKAAGNPTKLAENAESAMLTALRDKLDAHRDDVVAAGAQDIADALATANLQFIALERECRRFAAAQPAGTQSMGAARKQSDPAYTAIVNAINSYADLPSKKEYYGDAIAEINALALKYEAALSARHGKKSETAKAEPEKA